MNEGIFNINIRKSLKTAPATVTLEAPRVKLNMRFDGEIKLQ